ncbi:MAG: hypothetical protein K1X67_04380 [Fimbriimonadaceae bacterium]|nr:hypothetical protein [Fimbriimonadaceae bacterium]
MVLRTFISTLTLGLVLAAHASYDVRYTFVQLTPSNGYPYNPQLTGMTSNGYMIGTQPGDIFGPPPPFMFVRTPQGDQVLSGPMGRAYDGNSEGTIVGYSGGQPCRWVGGSLQGFDLPAGFQRGLAQVVNETGLSAGTVSYPLPNGYWVNLACAWQGTNVHAFIDNLPGSTQAEVKGINDLGVVIGRSYYSSVEDRGWVWDGTLTQLPAPSGTTMWNPEGINNDGLIAGWTSDGSDDHPTTWQHGSYRVWPYSGQFYAVNNVGVLAGRANLTGVYEAALWVNEEAIHLPSLIDNVSGTGPVAATQVNDRGQILVSNGILNPRPVFSGTVELDGFEGDLSSVEATIKVKSAGGVLFAQCKAVLSPSGAFSERLAVPSGACSVIVKAPGFLAVGSAANSTQDGASGLSFSMLGGDIDDDNEVSIGDYAILSSAFGSSPGSPNWSRTADLNGDDAVDIADYAILSANFGQVGED